MSEITFSDLIGKTILIGLTYYTADDEFIEQKQYWGTVIESNENRILVKLNDGEILGLPPDLSSTKILFSSIPFFKRYVFIALASLIFSPGP